MGELKKALKDIWIRNWLNNYCKCMTNGDKIKFEDKLKASEMFRGKRPEYEKSVAIPFLNSRTAIANPMPGSIAQYKCEVQKVDNKAPKIEKDSRGLFLLDDRLFLVVKGKVKRLLPYNKITEICISNKDDTLIILRTSE